MLVVLKGIIAVTNEYVIGCNEGLPWNIERDKMFFRTITKGKNLLMGRNTFEGIKKYDEQTMYYIISNKKNIYDKENFIGITKFEEM